MKSIDRYIMFSKRLVNYLLNLRRGKIHCFTGCISRIYIPCMPTMLRQGQGCYITVFGQWPPWYQCDSGGTGYDAFDEQDALAERGRISERIPWAELPIQEVATLLHFLHQTRRII